MPMVDNMERDRLVDVVVVGYGLAGAVAAITARHEGAEILILEKQQSSEHWSTSSASGGAFICPSDRDGAIEYLEGLYRVNEDLYWTDRDIIKAWAEFATENKGWIESIGGKVDFLCKGAQHPHIPGAESLDVYRFAGRGLGMMRFFYEQVKQRSIEVVFGARATSLITNSKGEVVGVSALRGQGAEQAQVNIMASRAVILTCGGFEFDEEMKLQYLGMYPIYFAGSPANTGDGIRMALGVGSDLWHMNCISGWFGAKFAEYPLAFPLEYGGRGWTLRMVGKEDEPEPSGFVLVDKYGKRFINENFKHHCTYYELTQFDCRKLDYPRMPCYYIFDDKRMKTGPLPTLTSGATGPLQLYKWSRDNSKELEKGWIATAGSIRELAKCLDVPPDSLETTVQAYNSYAQGGNDPEFGRKATDLVSLSNPPFYAMKLWPMGVSTRGGPRRNRQAQVLRADGQVVPRLYAAGELGSIYGMLYPGAGGALAECIAFGRIAGERAAKEKQR